jgi:hypothetical protein
MIIKSFLSKAFFVAKEFEKRTMVEKRRRRLYHPVRDKILVKNTIPPTPGIPLGMQPIKIKTI